MAKEVELKKIELKVTANCCDGCRRKVKKALQGIEGVMRTDIDRLQPKVIVLGSVDPRILIKKLSKVRKHAEILTCDSQNPVKEMKEAEAPMTQKCENGQINYPDIGDTKIDKRADTKNSGYGGEIHKAEVNKNENPQLPKPELDNGNAAIHSRFLDETRNVITSAHYGYVAEPYTINMPYYAIPSYRVTPLSPAYYGQPSHYYCESPRYIPTFQAPATQVGDYFSDENAMGCHIM